MEINVEKNEVVRGSGVPWRGWGDESSVRVEWSEKARVIR